MSATYTIPGSQRRLGTMTIEIEQYDDYYGSHFTYSLLLLRDNQEDHDATRIGPVDSLKAAEHMLEAYVAGYAEARRQA